MFCVFIFIFFVIMKLVLVIFIAQNLCEVLGIVIWLSVHLYLYVHSRIRGVA